MTRRISPAGLVSVVLTGLLTLPAAAAGQSSTSPTDQPGAPGATRLIFGPTGRMLDPGHGYVALDGPLVSVNVGVAKGFSMGGGTAIVPGSNALYWIIPKVRLVSRDTTQVSLCVVHAMAGDNQLGVVYVVSTTGTEDRSFSVGGALAYVHDASIDGDYTGMKAAGLVGGERRIHPHWSVITEDYLTTGGGFLSIGFRLHRRIFTATFSAISAFDFGEGLFVLPVVSLGWKF